MNARLSGALVAVVIGVQFLSCAAGARAGSIPEKKAKPPGYTAFGNPEMVQILGYNDNEGNDNNAMEPFISRDGQYLFFNNLNTGTAPAPTHLYWATRIDDVTFMYQGMLTGEVNSTGLLDAVASMDSNGNFFFITTRSYNNSGIPGSLSTIYSGPFAAGPGSVTPVNPAAGAASPKYGLIDFDQEISADGNTLYFTQGDFSTGNLTSTKMMVATLEDGTFVVNKNSAKIMKQINDKYLNYAADTSADELEFFFTRTNLSVGPATYMATRKSKSKPFGKPVKITAITGFAEAPSISPDGLSLYYHVKNSSGVFQINRVTRTMTP